MKKVQIKNTAVYSLMTKGGTLRSYVKYQGKWYWQELLSTRPVRMSLWNRSACGVSDEFALDHIDTVVGRADFVSMQDVEINI